MKKRIIFLSFLVVVFILISGCTNQNKTDDETGETIPPIEEPTTDPEEPDDPVVDTDPPVEEEIEKDPSEMTDEEFALWIESQIEKQTKGIEEISKIIEGMIPSEVNDNIELITEYTFEDETYRIIWSSNNYTVLSHTGVVDIPDDDTTVELTYRIKSSYVEDSFTINVFVKGFGEIIMPALDVNKKLVFAYLYASSFSTFTEVDVEAIDVVNYCFAQVSQGKIHLSNIDKLKEILKIRREHVRVVLSIGGGGDGSLGFAPACITKETRAILISSIMDFVKEYKLDGIDLDWEYPGWSGLSDSTANDKNNFVLLCKELREELDNYKEGLLLTSAVISGGSVSGISKFYDVKNLNLYLDYFHIMTYDGNISNAASHNSSLYSSANNPYSADRAAKVWGEAGVPKEKVVLGAAFYGKVMNFTTESTSLGSPTDSAKGVSYNSIMANYYNKNGFVEVYDEVSHAYYLTDGKTFVTYEPAKAIIEKCQYIIDNDYAGIMFWELSSDSSRVLLNTIYQEFK